MRKKELDPAEVRKLAAIGATIQEMCEFFGCSHGHLNRKYQGIINEGRSSGVLKAKGQIYRKAVSNGEYRSLALYLANMAGWIDRPPISVVTNVVQSNTPQRSQAETKKLLVELQLAVREEARRQELEESRQLPPS